ncbi:putative tbc domain-containing protein [Erysiphe neolycopersici]|uniref:Putative tbc domain-containing protein n=1 Tax=Erysiphe neolycopersici TaxID=212602 RepID=A0A420HGD0_9PEZI|nr:putative tbc domain-containing protein [Erysiphe neolycopersici]
MENVQGLPDKDYTTTKHPLSPTGLPIHLTALSSAFQDPLASPRHNAAYQLNANMGQNSSWHRKISEASHVQSLNHESQSQSTDCCQISEKNEAVTENFSRPRQASLMGRKETAWLNNVNNKSTPELPRNYEDRVSSDSLKSRDRELSADSLLTATPTITSIPRPLTSVPDYQILDTTHTKQRNLNYTVYKPSRSFTKLDYNISTTELNSFVFRDPLPTRSVIDGEIIRSSFRSAVTSNSSYLGTSGTERSSVVTKSSSRTSIFGRDEGMSVDDAIEMYEQGFTDSGGEDNYTKRPFTGNSEKNMMLGFKPGKKGFLVFPTSDLDLSHKSVEIFDTYEIETLKLPIKHENIIAIKETDLGEEASPSRPVTRSATTQFDDTRDRYGFRKKTQYVSLEEYEVWNKQYSVYLSRRKKKWISLMRQHNLPTIDPQDFPPRSDKIKRFIRKGIPPSWRGAAWFHYAGGPSMLAKYPGVYDDLVRRSFSGDMKQIDDEIIERDLNRTFPDNIKFKPDRDPDSSLSPDENFETPILQSLRHVLRAFSIYHPRIGYCQSLNFLAGLLLLFMNEEKAFWMMNIITRIFLPGTHSLNLEGANIDLGVLMSSIKDMMPSIWAKIGNELDGQPSIPTASAPMRLPPITLCTTAWFMSCFIGTLPIETTLRVWDSFFYEGSKTLFRIALTIFKLGESQIRAVTDPMEIFQVVQGIPRGMINCNHLMETCFKRRGGFVKLSQEDIERGREERRRGYAEERERIAVEANIAISGATRPKGGAKRGNTLFGRGKKERIGLPLRV